MKYLFLIAVLLSLLAPLRLEPVGGTEPTPKRVENCNHVCWKPLTKQEQCLQDLARRGLDDGYHRAFCDPRFIPSERTPEPTQG